MERLTRKMPGGYGLVDGIALDTLQGARAVVNRLAAYEDTGLMPEEITKALEDCADTVAENQWALRLLEELGELLQAKKDGRLVVLPCKVGDTVLVDVRTIPYNYLHPTDRCGDYVKCEIVSIATTKKKTYMKLRALYPSRTHKREYLRYGVTAIGKTVFLTREEAEAAMKGGAE